MIHEIRIDDSYANAIVEGRKNFEVRLNDRGYNAGDKVKFTAIKNYPHDEFVIRDHPLNKRIYNITYVYSGLGLKEGYVVFGIEPEIESEKEYGIDKNS